MLKVPRALSLLLLACGIAWYASAQTPAAGGRLVGAVTTIDAGTKHLTIKTDAGEEVALSLQDRASYYRVGADLKNPVKIELGEIAVGDRVVTTGALSEDKKSQAVSRIVVMPRAELTKKQEGEQADWKKRGVSGVITALNPESKEITISTHTHEGVKPLIITISGSVDMRRYAPDSVRFADAKTSAFADLKVGDQLRALGNKNEDGTRLTPEYLVSGTFRNIAATVISIDVAAKTIKVTDLDTKKPAVVQLEGDTTLRRLTPEVAALLARRVKGSAAESAAAGGQRGAGAGGGRPTGGPGGPAGGDIEEIIGRMPLVTLADLKPKDALIISSTAGVEPDKITAITLLAGVEPILTSAPKGRQGMALGNWNLGGGGGPE